MKWRHFQWIRVHCARFWDTLSAMCLLKWSTYASQEKDALTHSELSKSISFASRTHSLTMLTKALARICKSCLYLCNLSFSLSIEEGECSHCFISEYTSELVKVFTLQLTWHRQHTREREKIYFIRSLSFSFRFSFSIRWVNGIIITLDLLCFVSLCLSPRLLGIGAFITVHLLSLSSQPHPSCLQVR